MAEIDNANPLTPVWPQRPIRRVEEDESTNDKRRQRRQQNKEQGKREDNKDDGSPHIDEYV